MIGKTSFPYLTEGMQIYEKRLQHYLPFQTQVFPDVKNAKSLKPKQIKHMEGVSVLKKLKKEDWFILLDEKGKHFSSREFAAFIEQKRQLSQKRMVFLIGGAYGFSPEIYERANGKISLSKMTFSHQMIRLFAVEQIYRAMTILKGEPYHND